MKDERANNRAGILVGHRAGAHELVDGAMFGLGKPIGLNDNRLWALRVGQNSSAGHGLVGPISSVRSTSTNRSESQYRKRPKWPHAVPSHAVRPIGWYHFAVAIRLTNPNVTKKTIPNRAL